eukprot:TRINITY_DN470_c0_g1_i2.p1 TRINITY_DN470_c0_g1~~TRINITY_DN470_c0_g1_i2.p1  ORF type:complete len:485 (-),score=126.64 TRINITY_DN470_c0_g1_i2:290-1744(-)
MDITFVAPAPQVQVTSIPATRANGLAASSAGQQQSQSSFSTTKACAAVCGLVAAASLASKSKKRSTLRAAAAAAVDSEVDSKVPVHMRPPVRTPYYADHPYVAELVGDWKVPVPGSDKMLQTMVGGDIETGGGAWDPMGWCKLYDRNFDFNENMVYPHAQWHREAELKHGRCAMLAFVGILTQASVHIPGYPAQPDWTLALNDCYAQKLTAIGVAQISLFTMIVEGHFFPNDAWIGSMDREAGDLGFDPLKFTKQPGFDMKGMQLKELKNGRLAMIAVASLACHHLLPGSVPAWSMMGLPALAKDTAFCGSSTSRPEAEAKTAARYTTQTILPAIAWVDSGIRAKDIAPATLRAVTLVGNDVLIGKTEDGKLFTVGNLCPHIGTPMSEGADVIGDVIVCPLHGSSWKTDTGALIDWCPSPPIIGPLTGLVVEKKNMLIFECRESGLFGGGNIEVQVDTNAKKAYEADYWKGLLDAQGKDDGTFY